MAYATVKEFESRFRKLSEEEEARAAVLLEDASAMLEKYEDDDSNLAMFRIVACNMVRRAFLKDGDAFGLGEQDEPLGWSSALSSGDLRPPMRDELEMLRHGARIGTVEMCAL